MRKGKATRVGMAMVALLLTAAGAGAVEEFDLRRVRSEANNLVLYHDPHKSLLDPAGTLRVKLTSGGSPGQCRITAKPTGLREAGEAYTMLIVLDRGGAGALGMAPYSDALLGAIRSFTARELGSGSGVWFAIRDRSGTRKAPKDLKPTQDAAAVAAFLRQVDAPSGTGKGFFGDTDQGLNLFVGATTPLRAAIIISDGYDEGYQTTLDPLIKHAQTEHIPLFSILVHRGAPHGAQIVGELDDARKRLQKVSRDTGGVADVLNGDVTLEKNLDAKLGAFMARLNQTQRTVCALCGDRLASQDIEAQLEVYKGGTLAAQSPSETLGNRVHVLNPGPFGSCQVCQPDGDCGCDAGGNCGGAKGKGDKPSSTDTAKADNSRWLMIGGLGVLALGGGLGLWLRKRRQDAERQQRLQEEEERRQRQEAERQQRLQEEEQRRQQQQRDLEKRSPEKPQVAKGGTAADDSDLGGGFVPPEERPNESVDPFLPLERRPKPPTVTHRLTSEQGAHVDLGVGPSGVGRFLAGSGDTCAIELRATTISWEHAVFEVHSNGRVILTDLGSSNGTWVNDRKLEKNIPTDLRPGDRIALSKKVVFILHALGAPDAPPKRTHLDE